MIDTKLIKTDAVALLAALATLSCAHAVRTSANSIAIPWDRVSALQEIRSGTVLAASDSGLYVDIASGRETKWLVSGEAIALAVSAAGDVVFSRDDPNDRDLVHLFSLSVNRSADRVVVPVHRLNTSSASFPAFSPDGRRIAYAIHFTGTRHGIGIAAKDGTGERLLIRRPGRIAPIRWTPDGQWLYYGLRVTNGGIGGIRIERIRVDGGDPELVANLPFAKKSISTDPAWPGLSPNGKYLAVQSAVDSTGPIKLQILHADGSLERTYPAGRQFGAISWSSDGKYIIAADSNRLIKLRVF
jgi:Tol biopolymer transport system component